MSYREGISKGLAQGICIGLIWNAVAAAIYFFPAVGHEAVWVVVGVLAVLSMVLRGIDSLLVGKG